MRIKINEYLNTLNMKSKDIRLLIFLDAISIISIPKDFIKSGMSEREAKQKLVYMGRRTSKGESKVFK